MGRTALGMVFVAILDGGLANLGLGEASYDLYSGVAFVCVLALQVLIRRSVVDRERVRDRVVGEQPLEASLA